MEPWHLYDSKAPQYYIVTRVKGFATDIAARNATPFLHRYLYRDHISRCILSCFTVNMLYVNRTQANTAMVMRVLHNSVKELVDVKTVYVEATLVEKLARTQALFLYQIIRLLDGDVFLRAEGERDIPLLQNWLGDLCRGRDNLRDSAQLGDSVMKRQAPRKWEVNTAWCCRRHPRSLVLRFSGMDLCGFGTKDHCDGALFHSTL